MTEQPVSVPSRSICHRGLLSAWLLSLVLAAGSMSAQPLSTVVCANGGPNYTPFAMSEFLATDTGTPLLRHTLTGPDSRCNDGTSAVMYIRPADAHYTGPQLTDAEKQQEKWVIFFDGGGGCGDADGCGERWCNLNGFNRGAKMSTTGVYDAIRGPGILRQDPATNHFAGYNHVLIYYCSSDNYIGSQAHTSITAVGGPLAGTSYDIEFNGEAIVADVFNTLLAGAAPDAGPAATFYSTPLPSLATADEIVIAGESAGGGGVRHHLDSLNALLTAAVAGQPEIYGVIDAGAAPAMWEPWITWGAVAGAPVSYADYLLNWVVPRSDVFWGANSTAIDQSCQGAAFAAAHNAVGSHPEICYDTTYTLANHIETPFFLRMDINDTAARDSFQAWQLFPGIAQYWTGQVTLLNDLAFGAGGLEPFLTQPGVFGPKCDQHVSILTGDFYTHHISPVGSSFHDLLVNWQAGLAPATEIQPDFIAGPAYTNSICP
ncbi:MAG: pectin acetylesterase-family hydrolase [Acidobacteriota bacterium]|nr:pectin acetylesterase-family hydrolase [Acidobacteriota bacterium]